jgi:uncharacterized protein YcbK (DUF882 family)
VTVLLHENSRRRAGLICCIGGILFSSCLPVSPAFGAEQALPRFFFSGNGRMALENAHTGEKIGVTYRRGDGSYDPAALAEIRHLFRSRTDQKEGAISLRLIELLAYVQSEFHPKQILLISGYRSPDFNASLAGAAESSLHTQGLAADVIIQGVDLVALWKALREKRVGGVGLYEKDGYLHIDTGPPRFWEQQTSRVGERLSAENARVFARTPFDINRQLYDLRLTLHSVTLFPVRISRTAKLAGFPDAVVHLVRDYREGDRDCIEISADSARLPIEVGLIKNKPPRGKRTRLLLETCEPRLGKTPEVIESNEIELDW